MTTDTSEHGLERLTCTALAYHSCRPPNRLLFLNNAPKVNFL